MDILKKKEELVIQNNTTSIEELLAGAPQEILDLIFDASVVILPSHGSDDSFYVGTLDTLDYLKEHGLTTEVFATDDDYKELGLHGADIWLGTFVVKNFVIPIFCSLIAAYVYDKLKAKSDDNISVKFIVEDKEGKSTTVGFNGKADKLPSVLDEIKKFRDEK